MKADKISDNIRSQMRKGVLEYCILSILSRKEAYASTILQELKDANMLVVEGTIYPLLIRQKNQGLLSYRWEESPQGPILLHNGQGLGAAEGNGCVME